jgi:hypothetical protein
VESSTLDYEATLGWLFRLVGKEVTVALGGQEVGVVGVFVGAVERAVDVSGFVGSRDEDLMFKLSGEGKTFSVPREHFVKAQLVDDVLIALLSGGFLVIVTASEGLDEAAGALFADGWPGA